MRVHYALGLGLALVAACGEDDPNSQGNGGSGGTGAVSSGGTGAGGTSTGGTGTGGTNTGGTNTGGTNTGGAGTGGTNTGGTGTGGTGTGGTAGTDGGTDASAGSGGTAGSAGTGGTGGSAGVDAGCTIGGSGGTTVTWYKPFGTPQSDRARGVATDAGGNAFIAGNTNGDLGKPKVGLYGDAFLRKVDTGGNPVWTHQFGSSSNDVGTSAAVGPDGKLLVGGETAGSIDSETYVGKFDGFVRKLSDGSPPTVEWTHEFGTGEDEYVHSIAVDGSNNVIAVGRTLGVLETGLDAGAGGSDIYVRKINSAGTEVWTRQIGSSGNEQAYAVATDALGAIYVAGYTQGNLFGTVSGYSDMVLMKLSSGGNIVWQKQLGGTGEDQLTGIAVHYTSGDIYAVGSTSAKLGCAQYGASDAVVLKYDTTGNLQWATQLEKSAIGAVTLSSSGLFIGGTGIGATDAYVRKLDPATGSVLWTQIVQSTADIDNTTGLATDLSGNVFAVGYHDKLNDNEAFVAKLVP